eukprot:m.104872 g.104872  ORF g.104872 m.104872 type:complete len:255 (+) comp16854_c0_seq20:3119-3883(+)
MSAALRHQQCRVGFSAGYASCDGSLCSQTGFPCIHLVTVFGGVLRTNDVHPRYRTGLHDCHTRYMGVELTSDRKLFDLRPWHCAPLCVVSEQQQLSDAECGYTTGDDSDRDTVQISPADCSDGKILESDDVDTWEKLCVWQDMIQAEEREITRDAASMAGQGTQLSRQAFITIAKHITARRTLMQKTLHDAVRSVTSTSATTSSSTRGRSPWSGSVSSSKSLRSSKTQHAANKMLQRQKRPHRAVDDDDWLNSD